MDNPRGVLRGFTIAVASGAGGTVYVNVQPPEGEMWDLYAVSEMHDDAARVLQWCVIDDIGGLILPVYTSPAATAARQNFFNDTHSPGPIRVHHTCYIAAQVAAMAGAKTVTLNVIAERLVGVDTMDAS